MFTLYLFEKVKILFHSFEFSLMCDRIILFSDFLDLLLQPSNTSENMVWHLVNKKVPIERNEIGKLDDGGENWNSQEYVYEYE